MIILPIINRERILNVRISLKSANKIHSKDQLSGIDESDIIVNGHSFSNSIYNKDEYDLKKSVVDFIRNNSLLYKRDFIVTTRNTLDSNYYDVYRVDFPLNKVNDSLDLLYGWVIIDMMKEVPDKARSKYVSLKDLGFLDFLPDDKMLRKVTENNGFDVHDDVNNLSAIIDFMNLFDCTVVSEASIPEDVFNNVLSSFKKINSRDAKSLQRYYNIALDNKEVYSKLSRINKVLYNRPYSLIKSESQKQLIKTVGGDCN